ncbi:Tetratricopeptide-like helical, partial [Thalictrum thalictroides]
MKKVVKDENFNVFDEKLTSLVDLFSELSVKMNSLEKEMKGDLELDKVEIGGFDNYQNVIKSLSLDILQGKSIVESYVNDMGRFSIVNDEFKEMSLDDTQGGKFLNQKSNKKKRESFASYFDAFQFIGGLFQENASVAKPNKVKDTAKEGSIEPLRSKVKNDQNHVSVLVNEAEDMKAESDKKIGSTSQLDSTRNQALSQHVAEFSVDKAPKEVIQGLVNGNSTKRANDMQTLGNNDEFSNQNYSMPLTNKQKKTINIGHPNGTDMFRPHDNLYDPLDLGVITRSSEIDMRSFSMNSKASFQQEEILRASNGCHVPSYRRGKPENESYGFELMGNEEISGDPTDLDTKQAAYDSEEDSPPPSSSVISEDLVFNKHLTEATNLLREARECLKGKADEDKAEVKLYKSASLLARATAMKPMSLLAVGQLGNTFLLHGKLKLRISRELRTHLSKCDSSFSRVNSCILLKELDEQGMSRHRIASTLIDVCEECEGLLVEAGRQYRMALSIDGSDVRA